MRNIRLLFASAVLVSAIGLTSCGHGEAQQAKLDLGDTVPAKDFEPTEAADSTAALKSGADSSSLFILSSDAATTMEVKMIPSMRDTIYEKDDALQIHGSLQPGDTIHVVFGLNAKGEKTLIDVSKYSKMPQ